MGRSRNQKTVALNNNVVGFEARVLAQLTTKAISPLVNLNLEALVAFKERDEEIEHDQRAALARAEAEAKEKSNTRQADEEAAWKHRQQIIELNLRLDEALRQKNMYNRRAEEAGAVVEAFKKNPRREGLKAAQAAQAIFAENQPKAQWAMRCVLNLEGQIEKLEG